VDWADEPVRAFEVGIVVTVVNGKGVLARGRRHRLGRIDIVHLGMGDEVAQDALDLRFVITVRDRTHLTTCCAPAPHALGAARHAHGPTAT
jgi:GTP pyrophosphokinase